MRRRYAAPALFVVCVAAALFGGYRFYANKKSTPEAVPYTAQFCITANRMVADGLLSKAVTTEVHARDRHGRTYTKTERQHQLDEQVTEFYRFYVNDPGRLQSISWESNGSTAVVSHWPYWSGRTGCWADESGDIQSQFGDHYRVPESPSEGEFERDEEILTPSGEKRIKTHVVTENLGAKKIHGLMAFGVRMTMIPREEGGPDAMPEMTTENWYSEELNLNVLQITSGPKYGSKRTELADLQRGDPDSALFRPPWGYAIKNTTYHQVPCERK